MIYKDFQDLKLSALGMGCMRLPVVGGNDAVVDEAAAEEMVDCAMANGVNYYDTAWGYHNGNSEIALGKALAKHPREKFYIADKFPGYDLSNMPKVQEIFEEQLKKCRVDYFDFYLFHNVCEMNIDAYLDPQYGIHDYLMEQKRRGRIRHLGFSCHGNLPVLKRFLDAYGKDMEFCQLQLNYIDWTFQNGREKVELPDTLHSLRGGGKGPASAHWRRPVLKPLCFLVQLNDGVIQGDERQPDRIAEVLRPEDHLLGLLQIGVHVIHLVGHVGLFGKDLREPGSLLKFQVLDLVVVGIHAPIDPEAAPLVVDHVGLFVQHGDPDMHILRCHGKPPVSYPGRPTPDRTGRPPGQ